MELLELLKELAGKHRYAGTENESWACELLADRLRKIGCEVELEETSYIGSELYLFFMVTAPIWLLFGFALASGFVHSLIVGLGIIGFMAFMNILYPRIELKLTRARSTNIIGRLNPKEPQRLLLTAHYDSARIAPKYIQRFWNALRWVQSVFSLLILLLIGLLLGRGLWMLITTGDFGQLISPGPEVGLAGWPWSPIWWFYLVITAAMASLATAVMVHLLRGGYSLGADDNASGTVVLLELAERLGKQDLALGIDFCLFAAEERGLFGSRDWVTKHAKELDKEKIWVLNLDCVGRGEQFFINNGQGLIFKKRSDPTIVKLLEEACAELGLSYKLGWGAGTDHYEFVKRRFKCASILRCDVARAILPERLLRALYRIPASRDVTPRLIWAHSKDDTPERIEEKKLEETADLVELFVRKLEKKAAQGGDPR